MIEHELAFSEENCTKFPSSQEKKMSTPILTSSGKPRPLANFHPDVWGDRFLNYTPEDNDMSTLAGKEVEIEELKKRVRRELVTATASKKLSLFNDIQRLGLAYHFQEEIEEALRHAYETYGDDDQDELNDLYTVSLRFRLLRQQGFDASSDVFKKFKDSHGNFPESMTSDLKGMLSLYEAANLGKPVGDDILNEALAFTVTHLGSSVKSNSCSGDALVPQIIHSLKYPLLKSLPRMEARRYIPFYQDDVSHSTDLLKLAKLDFNFLQLMHKQELRDLVRWWKAIEGKLPYARSRVVELYFWVNALYAEPQYRLARKILTKVIALTSAIDDTYDSYATFEELQLLTPAIQRWNLKCLDQLPQNLKVLYRFLLDTFEEIEEEMVRRGNSYRVDYTKREMKRVVEAYFTEARWLKERYTPTMEEYMSVALVSSGYYLLSLTIFVGMEDGVVTKETFDWFANDPIIVTAASTICRLMDDIASHKFEQEREHVASAVEIYMKQYDASEARAKEELQVLVDKAWKDINEALVLNPQLVALLTRVLNLARVIPILYIDGHDGYTHVGKGTKQAISQMFIDPVPT